MDDGKKAAGYPFALMGDVGFSTVPPVQLLVQKHPLGWPLLVPAQPAGAGQTFHDLIEAGFRGVTALGVPMNQVAQAVADMLRPSIVLNAKGALEVQWQFHKPSCEYYMRNDLMKDVLLTADRQQG